MAVRAPRVLGSLGWPFWSDGGEDGWDAWKRARVWTMIYRRARDERSKQRKARKKGRRMGEGGRYKARATCRAVKWEETPISLKDIIFRVGGEITWPKMNSSRRVTRSDRIKIRKAKKKKKKKKKETKVCFRFDGHENFGNVQSVFHGVTFCGARANGASRCLHARCVIRAFQFRLKNPKKLLSTAFVHRSLFSTVKEPPSLAWQRHVARARHLWCRREDVFS